MCRLGNVLKKNDYDVIHVNGNSATMAFELIVARLMGVPKRIVHVHNSKGMYPILSAILYPIMKILSTDRIAVSELAGRNLFKGERFQVLNNAINCQRFKYDKTVRKIYRDNLGYAEKNLVIGTLGRISEQKNHEFLVQIFAEIIKTNSDAKLLIVGDGEQREHLEKDIMKLKVDKYVKLLGVRSDTAELLSAMDIFVFPSLWEGLGLALIEAQVSGLWCFSSDIVPEETKLSNNIQYIGLNKGSKYWAEQILKVDCYNREKRSEEAYKMVHDLGYDVESVSGRLQKFYNE